MSKTLQENPLRYFGNYRAKVINNNDPLKFGRVQAEIYPMFVFSDKNMLPWCVPAMPLSVGAGISTESAPTWASGQSYTAEEDKVSKDGRTYTCLVSHTSTVFAQDIRKGMWVADGYGTFAVPDVDTFIWVFFESGDPYQPVYFAEATTSSFGVPRSRETDYPNTRVVRTKSGIQFKFNDKKGSEDIRVDHPSGSWAEFHPNGKVTVHAAQEGGILIESEAADINLLAKTGNNYMTSGDKKATTVSSPDGSMRLDAAVVFATRSLEVGNAADGTFLSGDGKFIGVKSGIVISIPK